MAPSGTITDCLSGRALEQIANRVIVVLKGSGLSQSLASKVLEMAQKGYQETISQPSTH
jgi:hypothetical protein